MNQFAIYFNLGFNHIVNWGAVDHVLFIIALCLRYQFSDWKKLLILITAFTIGHTITLAISLLDIISYSNNWIEFLITITIIITALSNLFVKKTSNKKNITLIYWFALFFGLIHGLAFSTDLKSIIGSGDNAVLKLFAANIGIEAAQLLFVLFLLIINFILLNLVKINKRDYIIFISGAIFGIALYLACNRIPF